MKRPYFEQSERLFLYNYLDIEVVIGASNYGESLALRYRRAKLLQSYKKLFTNAIKRLRK